ncbi:hypothetical protein ASE66_13025 [Bosea sp. Root483D1]|uniref:hypothetical protein n=1 Tax=Bosea sp. Root483D1 TaxID=1736544 RepID=UPI0007097690|nr:hypothetical protein [Bosea sp. Root483D1]KRE14308.1 hypothetical protein ASE66_13025 [Bosea sp. Root483D1]
MSYAVKLAIFPPWKAPVPSETVGTFATIDEATAAGGRALMPIAERELIALAGQFRPVSAKIGGQSRTSIDVPDQAVHGFLIYDAAGVEVFNWTTLDVAVQRAALEPE